MGIHPELQQGNGKGTDGDMRSVSRVLVCHEPEGRDLSFLFFTRQVEPDPFSHVCREPDGSRSAPSSSAHTDPDRRDDHHQITCSDSFTSLSRSSVSLLGTLCELHAEYDQDGRRTTEFAF